MEFIDIVFTPFSGHLSDVLDEDIFGYLDLYM
jgi:hypothetical protein